MLKWPSQHEGVGQSDISFKPQRTEVGTEYFVFQMRNVLKASDLAKLVCSVSVGGQSGNALGFRLPPCGLASASIHGPWADALRDMMSRFALEHSIVLDYVMPHFGADSARPVPRPAKYACVVGLLRRALRCPPLAVSEAASVQVTLHACRRLLPTLAGQMLMSIESRRVLGHWGPQSAEPQRYDTSRCVCQNLHTKRRSQPMLSPAGGRVPILSRHRPLLQAQTRLQQHTLLQRQTVLHKRPRLTRLGMARLLRRRAGWQMLLLGRKASHDVCTS